MKAIKIDAANFASQPIRIINPFDVAKLGDETVWNTGLSAAGFPHADEVYSYSGQATIEVEAPEKKFSTSFQLFRTNQMIVLNPGDEIVINPNSEEEALYYIMMPDSPFFKIVNRSSYITEKSFVITSASETVEEESTLALTATATGFTAGAVTWASSDEDVATVANGTVTGVAEGVATITATTTDSDGIFTYIATKDITVTAKA